MMTKLSRRDFMRRGCSGLAVLSVPFVFKSDPLKAFANSPAEAVPLNGYYKMFGVDEALIRRIMGVALGKGGDYCDLYFQNRVFHYMGLEDNIVNNAYTGVDYGVGIRVLKGDQTGYSFTEEITPDAMEQAAQTAASIADSGKTLPPQELKLPRRRSTTPSGPPGRTSGRTERLPSCRTSTGRFSPRTGA
jgi:TldD protein